MVQLDLIRIPQAWILLVVGVGIYALSKIWQNKRAKNLSQLPSSTEKLEPEYSEDAYYDIEPLPGLDIETEEPIKIRPFKPKYFLTMAIQNITLSDLVAMDKTYKERIALRRQLIQDEGENVLALNEKAYPAVFEIYEWLIHTYLPRRFPTVFTLTPIGLHNKVTSETLPLTAPSAVEALRILGGNIDDEFLFLIPSSNPADEGKYRLEAFITCFPSGFNTRRKLGLLLRDIHTPVPGYSDKLEKSMDRFFASLPVGKIVKRFNWSITTNRDLFNLSGNHATEEEVATKKGEDFDIDQTVLRCERQTLHRLPKTKALVFGFKTYQYPIRELRDEGSGEELAQAIDGLGTGNVPGMTVYKRQVVWGERVKAFLRGEIDA